MSYSTLETLKKAKAGDSQARERVLRENYGLVVNTVMKLPEKGIMSRDDMIQEGFIALLRAIDLYKPEKGFQFSTYAGESIYRYVQRTLQNFGTTIRIPVHMHKKDMSALQNVMHPASLSALIGEYGTELGGLQPDAKAEAAFDQVSEDGVEIGDELVGFGEILSLVDQLDEPFRQVIELRFGLNGNEETTLKDVAKLQGVTGEAVRLRETKALAALAKAWNTPDRRVESLKAQAGSRELSRIMKLIERLPADQRNALASQLL